jgi:drug/metabolite transporter (DMT)-like permease
MSDSSASTSDRPLRGILLFLGSTLAFIVVDAISKFMTAEYGTIQILWTRYVVFSLVVVPVVLRHGLKRALLSVSPATQIVRSICAAASGIVFLTALVYLPLPEAITIAFVSPFVVTALAIPLLGEKVGLRRWIAIAVGFGGVVVVIRPGAGIFGWEALLPILSATIWAYSLILTRRTGKSDSAFVTVTYTNLVGLFVTSIPLWIVWRDPSLDAWLIFAFAGGLNLLGQYLLVQAFALAPASTLAPFSYSGLVWSIPIGYLLFHSVPDWQTYLGAAIIMASGVYVWHRERAVRRGVQPVAEPADSRALSAKSDRTSP